MSELIIKHLSKSFGAVKALTDCGFTAKMGEVHALMGENGAGKSTLIKILSGVVKADTGDITWKGEPLHINGPAEAIHKGISTVYQELSLIPDLTVAQNVFYRNWPTPKRIISPKLLLEKTRALFEKYGVSDIDPKAVVANLPLSHQQTVEIIKVLARDPEIIILDEATSALSSGKVEWLLSLSQRLAKEENKLVLFISHRLHEINKGCDRITVLRNGQFVAVRELAQTNNDELVTMMLGRSMEAYYPKRIGSATKQPMMQVENLSAGKALTGVNFTLHKGEILGVGGLAGQGQSALFLSLFGIGQHEGTITIDGKREHFVHPLQALKKGVALVPEDRGTQGLVQSMSIRENISITTLKQFSSLGFIRKRAEVKKVEEGIRRVQIKCGGMEHAAGSMSGGNQQKTVLAKFLLSNPRVLLLFDVTRGVDIGTKLEIFMLMQTLARQGNAILFYSTDMEELVNLCDRVIVMCDKTVSATIELPALNKSNILKASVGEAI